MAKQECKNGHEYTEENTYINPQGARVCRTCSALRTQEYRLRNPQVKKGHWNVSKTHCPAGHMYTDENTYTSRNKRYCKTCAKNHHSNFRFKKYGITEQQYDALLTAQNNCCAICEREFERTPHIDHNHETGKARGLLCYPCNGAIGSFQESIESLKKALAYLESFIETDAQ